MTLRTLLLLAVSSPLALATACTSGGAGGSGGATTTSSTTTCHGLDPCGCCWDCGCTGVVPTGSVCDAYADAKGIASVTLRVHNETGVTIGVPPGPGCSKGAVAAPFVILGVGDPSFIASSDSCLQTCGDLLTQGPWCCDCASGPPTGLLEIPAGQTADLTWDGAGTRMEAMPEACYSTHAGACPTSQLQCPRQVAATAGSYEAQVSAYYGTTLAQSAKVTFTFPAAAPVDVVFDGCAFGCPDGGP